MTRAWRDDRVACRECGYDLTALGAEAGAVACPECGKVNDPANADRLPLRPGSWPAWPRLCREVLWPSFVPAMGLLMLLVLEVGVAMLPVVTVGLLLIVMVPIEWAFGQSGTRVPRRDRRGIVLLALAGIAGNVVLGVVFLLLSAVLLATIGDPRYGEMLVLGGGMGALLVVTLLFVRGNR